MYSFTSQSFLLFSYVDAKSLLANPAFFLPRLLVLRGGLCLIGDLVATHKVVPIFADLTVPGTLDKPLFFQQIQLLTGLVESFAKGLTQAGGWHGYPALHYAYTVSAQGVEYFVHS